MLSITPVPSDQVVTMLFALYLYIFLLIQAPIAQSQSPNGSPEHSSMNSDFDWIQYLADSTSPFSIDSTQASSDGKVENKNIVSVGSESTKPITTSRVKLGEYRRMKAKIATLPKEQGQAILRAYNAKSKARRLKLKEKIGFSSRKDARLSHLRDLERQKKGTPTQLRELIEYRERKLRTKRASLTRLKNVRKEE